MGNQEDYPQRYPEERRYSFYGESDHGTRLRDDYYARSAAEAERAANRDRNRFSDIERQRMLTEQHRTMSQDRARRFSDYQQSSSGSSRSAGKPSPMFLLGLVGILVLVVLVNLF